MFLFCYVLFLFRFVLMIVWISIAAFCTTNNCGKVYHSISFLHTSAINIVFFKKTKETKTKSWILFSRQRLLFVVEVKTINALSRDIFNPEWRMITTLPKTKTDNVPVKVPVWLRKLITISKIMGRHTKEIQQEYKRNASFRQSSVS